MRSENFQRLFEEHAEGLFAFLAYRTGNRVVAEDLLGDTFERVLRAHRRFDPRRGSERQWLYAIALNLVRDQARRQISETRALESVGAATAGSSATQGGFDALEERDALQAALRTLSEPEREALALRYGADLKLRDVARILDVKEDALEGRIYRALRKLRDELE